MQYILKKRKVRDGMKTQDSRKKALRILSKLWTHTMVLSGRNSHAVKDATVLPRRTETTLPKEVSQRMADDIINEIENIRIQQRATGEVPMRAVEEISVQWMVTEGVGMKTLEGVSVPEIFNGNKEKVADMMYCVEGYCWKTSAWKIVHTCIHRPS